jgi:ferredoxin
MKLEVDWDRCEGHGMCESTAPEMFQLDDNGDMHLLLDGVPADLEAKVAAAAKACPMTALKVTP